MITKALHAEGFHLLVLAKFNLPLTQSLLRDDMVLHLESHVLQN